MPRWMSILLAAAVAVSACSADADSSGDQAGAEQESTSASRGGTNSSPPPDSPSTTDRTPTTTAPSTTTTPPPTAETDADVLAAFVEEESGLQFGEPPEVAYLAAPEDDPDAQSYEFIDARLWALFEGLGLVEGGDEARMAASQARLEQVRGFCCPVRMYETDDDPLLTSVVLVHELTHLIDLLRPLGDYTPSDEPIFLPSAVFEGNAQRVALNYQSHLEEAGADPSVFTVDFSRPAVPPAIVDVLSFPYTEGHVFSATLAERGGLELVQQSFDRLPTTSEQILDVDAYLADEQPLGVPTPPLPAGTTSSDEGSIGAYILKLVIDSVPDGPGEAETLDLVTRWAGDRYVLFGDGERTCLVAFVVMDDGPAASSLADLLTRAGLDAVVAPDDDHRIDLASCPPPSG